MIMAIFELSQNLKSFLHEKLDVSLSNLVDDVVEIDVIENSVCIKNGDVVVFHAELNNDAAIGNVVINLKAVNRGFVLIIISNKGCHVIDMLDKKVHFWYNGCSVVVDDYLQRGHDQIIIHLRDNHYIITDFDCCSHDTRRVSKDRHESFMKSQSQGFANQAVLNSLHDKISRSLNHGQILKSNNREKENLIKQSWNAFKDISLDQKTSTPKFASLVPLCNKNSVSHPQHHSLEPHEKSLETFKMVKHWIRKLSDGFVFGFVLKHTFEMALCNCSTSLTLKNQITHTLSLLSNRKFTSGGESWKLESEELFLTSVNFPLHGSLTYYDFDISIQFCHDGQEKKICCFYVDSIKLDRLKVLSLECVSNKDFYMRDEEDKLCYDLLTYKKEFVLESKITHFHSILNQLCLKFNCTQMTVNNLTILRLKHIQGEIYFHSGKVPTTGTIFALSRENVALLFSELKSILPADVSFKLQISPQKLNEARKVLLDETEYRMRSNDVIILDSPPEHPNQALQNKILDTDRIMSQIFSS